MTFMDSISACFSKYITFSGRAQRSEFWWFVLFLLVGQMIAGAADSAIFGNNVVMLGGMEFSYNAGYFGNIFALVTFLPAWAVEIRRLHDIGKSGWWLLLWLIPLIGFIILLIWLIRKGTDGDNEYGADPLA
jgi:uncharacterized membrane protein YhaH (DUF805 family)